METKVALLGNPVEYSPSQWTHPAIFQQLRLVYEYRRMRTDPEELSARLKALWEEGFNWLAVTMPLKSSILEYMHEITSAARESGAVNFVLRGNDGWVGDNTDGVGAAAALMEVIDLEGARCLVLGTGGAARAIVHELRNVGALPVVLGRRPEAAFLLGETVARPIGEYDVVINATSVGMNPHPGHTPADWSRLYAKVAMDVVSSPRETLFLKEAAQRGARTVSGWHMFAHLVREQFRRAYGLVDSEKIVDTVIDFAGK